MSRSAFRLGFPRSDLGQAVPSARTSAFGNQCPASGGTRRLNIGQWICALLVPSMMGALPFDLVQGRRHGSRRRSRNRGYVGQAGQASAPSMLQPIPGKEH
jgi:hypothetical protein